MRWRARRVVTLSDLQTWHEWFAWYPVRVGYMRVWLEPLERRLTGYQIDPDMRVPCFYEWEYRSIVGGSAN